MGNCGTTYGGLTGKTKEDFGHGNARFIPYTNVFDNPLTDTKRLGAVEIDSSQNQVAYGDAFFTVSSETPDEVGMSSVWLSDQEDVYLNSFCFGYRQDSTFDPHYLAYMLRSRSVRSNLTLLAQGISRFNISKNKVMELSVPVPSAVEQEQLGQYFTKLDSLITLHQRECGKPPFNQSPAWEQRKLGELCELNPTAVLPDSFEYVDLESVAGTDMISHRREEKLTAPSRAQRLASFGDIFYQTVRPYQKNNYFYELPDEDYVFSTGYAQLRPLCDGRFLFSSLQRDQFVSCVLEHCTGTSYPAINANDLAALFLAVPIDAEEQRLVGSILKPIDSLITLHQRMCPIFSFCAHGSRTNFAQTLQGWLQILRYPRPIPKMLVSPSAPASGVFGTAKGAFICASSSAGASTSSPSARKNFITSSTLCCRDSLSSL